MKYAKYLKILSIPGRKRAEVGAVWKERETGGRVGTDIKTKSERIAGVGRARQRPELRLG